MRKALLALALIVAACTDERESERALKAYGFTDVEFTGYEYFGCSDSDNFHTGFRAKSPKGEPVSGVVCCGWMKACTVRF